MFGHAQPSLAGGAGGFRISGAGGMGTIASILSASGFSFRAAGEDDDEELHIVDTLDDGHGATVSVAGRRRS